MARSTMGSKIDKLEFPKLGIEIDIRFDKSNGYFRAEYQGKNFLDATLAGIKNQLTETVNKSATIFWQPILQIRFHLTSDQDGGVGWMLNAKRFYAYLNPNPEKENRPWMRCDWDAPEDKRLGWARVEDTIHKKELPFFRNFTYGEKNSEVFIPYDQELWERLTIAKDGMRHFRDALQRPLLSVENLPTLPDTLTRFMSALQIMYPAPAGVVVKESDPIGMLRKWFFDEVGKGRDPEDIFHEARCAVEDDLSMEVEAYKATHKE